LLWGEFDVHELGLRLMAPLPCSTARRDFGEGVSRNGGGV
jgi:hypothetical protein